MIENLKLVGTSHISVESIKQVKKNFLEFKPDYVCVELDRSRLYALINKEKAKGSNPLNLIKEFGIGGFIFMMIGQFIQKKLGKIVKINPGSDMLEAVKLANINKVSLVLIDQDIKITIKKLMKNLTWKEKSRFILDLILGFFNKSKLNLDLDGSNNKSSGPKKGFIFDLKKVPGKELIKKMISIIKKRYPITYKVLIHDRNIYMSNQLVRLIKIHPNSKIMAVIGAGHKEEMLKMIEDKLSS